MESLPSIVQCNAGGRVIISKRRATYTRDVPACVPGSGTAHAPRSFAQRERRLKTVEKAKARRAAILRELSSVVSSASSRCERVTPPATRSEVTLTECLQHKQAKAAAGRC